MENDKGMHIPRSMHMSKNQELDPYEIQTRHLPMVFCGTTHTLLCIHLGDLQRFGGLFTKIKLQIQKDTFLSTKPCIGTASSLCQCCN